MKINPSFDTYWTQGKGLCIAEIYINSEPLIELVRHIEEPFVKAEIKEWNAEVDEIDKISFPSGNYKYLPISMVLLPSRNFLDEPWNHGFTLKPDDSRIGKATVLDCTCGITECWFMQVRITLNTSTVMWSEFSQFHRDWKLDFGPFTFDRKQYEAELCKSNYE